MKTWHPITVRTYAGYRRDESPRAFQCGDLAWQISRVLRYTQEQTLDRRSRRRFHVLTTEGEEFILVHEVESGNWYLEIED